jgi:choline dehydrogenase-like flavoprotein
MGKGKQSMKILMIGAGVFGSLYAARLQGAGNHVTMLAQGRRVQVTANLFMVNNPSGPQALMGGVGRARVLLGFPGTVGKRDGEIIRFPYSLDAFARNFLDCNPGLRRNPC